MKNLKTHIINTQPKIKKRWEKPFLEYLDINKTKNGDYELDSELTLFGYEIGHS